jgi:succinate dehydrogenase/fumarate reductase cytochrome b subunit
MTDKILITIDFIIFAMLVIVFLSTVYFFKETYNKYNNIKNIFLRIIVSIFFSILYGGMAIMGVPKNIER